MLDSQPKVSKSKTSQTEPKALEKAKETEKKTEVKPEKKSSKRKKQDKKPKPEKVKKKASLKQKFWIASTGHDYVGSSVTVVVNGHPIDNFFGPGKLIDVSKHVKKGLNELSFESKVLEDDYNQHLGESKYDLTLKLVTGPSVTEIFDPSSVLLSFKRTAADVEDSIDTMKFRVQ